MAVFCSYIGLGRVTTSGIFSGIYVLYIPGTTISRDILLLFLHVIKIPYSRNSNHFKARPQRVVRDEIFSWDEFFIDPHKNAHLKLERVIELLCSADAAAVAAAVATATTPIRLGSILL